ncbi:4-(cytidine 5'-diphospho)-2-C-methyl-D-erythritol kinase [Alkalimonas delamerensis]|uniref:4-diphosphocytidyl-2-C-methyl-D-erythritol kinase n=1 Tax=Alkalimonas delamerensis TaxID=265981 RepID=A0ABT9GR54_9GAMM|nr:4-(cytidine 5'-diphospho)-2-C-methyl-D-erythritol kinase [Alkalimonas delamerensis]MDP4529374.1 4-(cytidine 5'-diphospho)-2-C-methyl-D-erythritol kinase [Alkalimonas delamerensis]
MSRSLSLPAIAKLNLFLHITGQRADGYHELQSIFQLLDYGDTLHLSSHSSPELTLSCNQPALVNDDNLVLRAARLLQQHTGCRQGAQIQLDKVLPLGGGIGGGSSDAASTLLALNQLWQLGLSQDELAGLGLQLGADVPIFVRGRTAFAEGVGEKITPIELPSCWYLVVTPDCHISTKTIFQHADLPRNTPKVGLDQLMEIDWRNDCQALVCRLYPNVAITLQWLLEYAPSRMTGTGASVFAAFSDRLQAEAALRDMPAFCSGFIARGVSESPALTALTAFR